MGAMLLPQRLRQQPQQAAVLDRSNPLARGLVGFWLPNGGGFVSALPGVPDGVLTANASPGASPRGRNISSKADGMTVSIPHDSRWKPTSAITVLVDFLPTPRSAYYLFGCENSSDGYGSYNGGGRAYIRIGGGWVDLPTGMAGYSGGLLGLTYDGAAVKTYNNGRLNASQAATGTITNSLVGMGLNAMNSAGGGSTSSFPVTFLAIWSRALSASELASFYANPWQLFRAPARRIWTNAITGTPGPITGTTARTEGSDTATGAGSASFTPISGTAARTENPDTASGAGTAAFAAISGTSTPTEAPDVASGSGSAVFPSLSGAAAATEGSDAAAIAGAVLSVISGSVAATEEPDTLAAGILAPVQQGGSGGGAGSVREVRAFADLLERKPSRSQKKARRRALEAEALELLPDLPEAEKLAPIAARIVYEQEARALAPLYANREIAALAPVAIPFDAHEALRQLVDKLLAEAALQQKVAEDEENDVELLLFGT